MRCPCCGSPLQRDEIVVALDHNRIAVGWHDEPLRLSPLEMRFADLLARAMPRIVSYDVIAQAVWPAPDFGATNRDIYVLALHTRRKLRPIGLSIVNFKDRGYRMVVPAFTKLRAAPREVAS